MHSGNPRIVVRLPPPLNDGTADSAISIDSHHVRYTGPDIVLRLTTDASINAVVKHGYRCADSLSARFPRGLPQMPHMTATDSRVDRRFSCLPVGH